MVGNSIGGACFKTVLGLEVPTRRVDRIRRKPFVKPFTAEALRPQDMQGIPPERHLDLRREVRTII